MRAPPPKHTVSVANTTHTMHAPPPDYNRRTERAPPPVTIIEQPTEAEVLEALHKRPQWLDNPPTATSGSTPAGQGALIPRRVSAPPPPPRHVITQDAMDTETEDTDISELLAPEEDFDLELAIPEPGEIVFKSFLCVGGPWGGAMYTVANKSRVDIHLTVYGAKGVYRFEPSTERPEGYVLRWELTRPLEE